MQKLILIRFGLLPDPRVSMALRPHIAGTAFASPVPGAIMTLFTTNSKIDEIERDIREVGVFFILADMETSKLCLPREVLEIIEREFINEPQPSAQATSWTMDELLDIIHQTGIDSLTAEQRNQLESLS
jgi:hypothetical protein